MTRVGTYAVAGFESRPWLSAPTKPPKKGKTPVLVNPIFAECAQLIDDPLWKALLEQASRGKFPKGFTYRNGILTHKLRSKVATLLVPQVPHEALMQCVDFIRRMGQIVSEADRLREQEMEDERRLQESSIHNCTWNEIKKKKVKAVLLAAFVETEAAQHHLTSKEMDQLTMIMNLGMTLGYLNKEDVIFQEGAIRRIEGLFFDPKQRRYYIDPKRTPKLKKISKVSPSELKSKLSFLDMWQSFVDYLASLRGVRISQKITTLLEDDDSTVGTQPTTATSFYL